MRRPPRSTCPGSTPMPDSRASSTAQPLLQHLSGGTAPAPDRALPHVLLVVDGFPRSLGGGERVVLRLAATLPRYGFRVSILTFSIDPASSFQPEASPCPLYLLPLTKTYNFEAWRGALALRQLIRREHIVLVHTFFESSDLWAGLVTRLLTSAKLIWSRRDMGILRGRKHAHAYRLLCRLPHGVHAVSEQVRTHAIQVDGVPPQRTLTLYNGLDLGRFPHTLRDNHGERLVVLTVGNIRRVKGHDVFIKAAARVHANLPDVTFLVAGEVLEQPYFEELLALIKASGLGDRFHFLGGVDDLPSQLAAADLFVLPSRSEGFSNSLVEAMACALPVIATDVGGNAEAVERNETGLIVPSENDEALAEAMLALLSSPETRLAMGAAGKRRAEGMFSADAMMQKLTTSYIDILTKR